MIATAGHVDHGKSTLVRALTGRDPDRWEAERARGLTIDLGYAWTTLPDGEDLAFVDVPGHQRFIGNMLAGLGPAPAVMFCVAADEGWRAQSAEHADAVRALGIAHGLLVITRADLADPDPALAQARAALAGTSLAGAEAVAVSAFTGAGLAELRAALGRLAAALPAPDPAGRVRLWIDRVFTIKGAGTVVTGTLESGTIAVGDTLDAAGRRVTVRGIQSLELPRGAVSGVARVALNLRGVDTNDLARGDALLTPDAWRLTDTLDARLTPVARVGVTKPVLDAEQGAGVRWPSQLSVHAGTGFVTARLRPLGADVARFTLSRPVPLAGGDRLVLRDPGRAILGGALVLDADPPALTRRGAARARAEALRGHDGRLDPSAEVARRGFMRADDLRALGGDPDAAQSRREGSWLVAEPCWSSWATRLADAVDAHAAAHPLQARMPIGAAAAAVSLPDPRLAAALASDAGLVIEGGHLARPGAVADLGHAEAGLAALERRLAASPFAAPERDELAELGLAAPQVAAAVRLGRLIDLGDQTVLAPSAPALAMRRLAALPQPFTTAQAKEALGTTRRVAIPLLEHLDRRGWTRRVDAAHREVVR